jgi:hypothetical protein
MAMEFFGATFYIMASWRPKGLRRSDDTIELWAGLKLCMDGWSVVRKDVLGDCTLAYGITGRQAGMHSIFGTAMEAMVRRRSRSVEMESVTSILVQL